MIRFIPDQRSPRRLPLAAVLISFVMGISGCHVSPGQHVRHLCGCPAFVCDDYQSKCSPDVCIPYRRSTCSDHSAKCSPNVCLPQRSFVCDNFNRKCPPDICDTMCAPACEGCDSLTRVTGVIIFTGRSEE